MTDPYSSERYDPKLPPCGTLSLRFDGRCLRMSGGSQSDSYRAVSAPLLASDAIGIASIYFLIRFALHGRR